MQLRLTKLKLFSATVAVVATQFFQPAAGQALKVIATAKAYRQSITADSLQAMAEVKAVAPTVRYNLVYATANNFTGTRLYVQGRQTFLRVKAAMALKKVADSLAPLGLGLLIWDAYRPYSITKKMWDLVHDERYVANPAKGSGHNRGLAVDLTLVDLTTGLPLPMGTGFDNFTDSAHNDFTALPGSVLANRKLLRQKMEKEGFRQLETEWWHFSYPNDRGYDVLDLSFKQLAKKAKK